MSWKDKSNSSKKANVDKDSTFTAKELQLHFHGLCKHHEIELIRRQGELVRTESALKEVEDEMVDLKKEVAKKESNSQRWEEEFARKEAGWDEEKLQLQRGCVDAYEEGFMKAMKQALCFLPT